MSTVPSQGVRGGGCFSFSAERSSAVTQVCCAPGGGERGTRVSQAVERALRKAAHSHEKTADDPGGEAAQERTESTQAVNTPANRATAHSSPPKQTDKKRENAPATRPGVALEQRVPRLVRRSACPRFTREPSGPTTVSDAARLLSACVLDAWQRYDQERPDKSEVYSEW